MRSAESKTIVENINIALERLKISKNELAKRSGLAMSTVARILSGDRNFTIDKMIPIARALNMSPADFFSGIQMNDSSMFANKESDDASHYSVGVMSIGKRRITSVMRGTTTLGTSDIAGDLDLAEPTSNLLELIKVSINSAFSNDAESFNNISLKLVTQSYEFTEKRKSFLYKAKQLFNDVILIPDWQITYLADFKEISGMSLVVDKGVSLSYMHEGHLRKLGGWKFPTYDLGGENWLGVETIHHTIEAAEGFREMSGLAEVVLSQYDSKIEKIVEACFKGVKDADVYCLFAEILIHCYYRKDKAAEQVILSGLHEVKKLVKKAEDWLGENSMITINGSLANIYKEHFDSARLVAPSSNSEKVSLLAGITREFLVSRGVEYLE